VPYVSLLTLDTDRAHGVLVVDCSDDECVSVQQGDGRATERSGQRLLQRYGTLF